MAADHAAHAAPAPLRLFYALWPDAATRAALVALQSRVSGRPTRPDNLHLTLAFLGPQPAAALPLLQSVLAALPAAAIPLTLNCSGYFPRHRIAWIGPEPVPAALLDLQQQLMQALAQQPLRYEPPARFMPHVTLARNAAQAPPAVATPVAWRSSQIVLVQSDTLAQGARYRVLASRELGQ